MGKSQVAAHYARRAWNAGDLDLLVWATASSPEAVISRYSQAGAEVLGVDSQEPDQAASAFLAWLDTNRSKRWLVVLDDVSRPSDMTGLWPPNHPSGRTVVTTRNRDAAFFGNGRHRIDIGLFTSAEALSYLTARLAAAGRSEPADQLSGLAADFGNLPLALAQAVPYMINRHLDCAAYRRRLADQRRTLTALLPGIGGLPDDQQLTVAAAWSLSVALADQLPPQGLARPLLELAAMLDPNGIPHRVLTGPLVLTYLENRRADSTGPTRAIAQPPAPLHITVEDASDGLWNLHQLSLIDHTPETPHQAVRVHQIIQRTVRDPLPAGQYEQAASTAADALIAAWPAIERDTTLAQALRSNADALRRAAEDTLWHSGAHPVLFRAGTSLGSSGQSAAAAAYFQRLEDTAQRRLGSDHPDSLTTRQDLAEWRGEAGDAAGTVAALEQVLADRERVLGPDHPDTLTTRHSLAYWRGEVGDAAGTVAALEQVLADRMRVLGPDHPDTLTTRGYLGLWRGRAGDVDGAVAALEQVLPDRERVLGPDHPDTLTARGNLAYWRGEAGDAAGTVAALEQVLADRERVLGPDHPDTLTTRGNLAYRRGETGDGAGAITAYEDLLTDQERVLGPDHPNTLSTRASLGL
ncbi:tetratricopeptide repeat protein [Streptomyces sp. NRRL B-24484]|uniref:tetratricopeptide repeat protein n=1 Tax=Streptomyces sp. NRRL B-24484 TaxID=1463833 RepID=UPI0013312F11